MNENQSKYFQKNIGLPIISLDESLDDNGDSKVNVTITYIPAEKRFLDHVQGHSGLSVSPNPNNIQSPICHKSE